MKNEKVEWKNIYQILGSTLQQLDTEINVQFQVVKLDSEQSYWGIDWWPRTRVAERIQSLREHDGFVLWHSGKGVEQTAHLLYENRGNPEAISAVFLGAAIQSKNHNLPEKWRGEIWRMMQNIRKTIYDKFPDVWWHHAMRDLLPMTIDRVTCPESIYDLIYIFALEANLSLANWQLVNIFSARGLKNHIKNHEIGV